MSASESYAPKFPTVEYLHDERLGKIRNPFYKGPIKKQLEGIVLQQKRENVRKKYQPRGTITVDGTPSHYNVGLDPLSRAFKQQHAPAHSAAPLMLSKETLTLENDIANSLVDYFSQHARRIGQVYEIVVVGTGEFFIFLTNGMVRLLERMPSGKGQTKYPQAWLLQMLHEMVEAEVLTAKVHHDR